MCLVAMGLGSYLVTRSACRIWLTFPYLATVPRVMGSALLLAYLRLDHFAAIQILPTVGQIAEGKSNLLLAPRGRPMPILSL